MVSAKTCDNDKQQETVVREVMLGFVTLKLIWQSIVTVPLIVDGVQAFSCDPI